MHIGCLSLKKWKIVIYSSTSCITSNLQLSGSEKKKVNTKNPSHSLISLLVTHKDPQKQKMPVDT
jgi:hypothetical protein